MYIGNISLILLYTKFKIGLYSCENNITYNILKELKTILKYVCYVYGTFLLYTFHNIIKIHVQLKNYKF